MISECDPVDGNARVVSSGGTSVTVWKLQTSPAPSLTNVTSSPAINVNANGFYTVVSSNGIASPVIGALARPARQTPP